MSIEKRFFGKLDGKGDVDIYKITNKNGAFVELMTLGAGIHSINVPEKNGKLGDVILGFDDVNNYLNPDLGYQGLVVGRYANRIRDAKFSMDGVEYNTPKNQGTWTLHGGGRFSFNIWEVKETGNDFVVFSFFSPDMQDGFPGNFTIRQITHISIFQQIVQKLLKTNICRLMPINLPKPTIPSFPLASLVWLRAL